MALVMPPMGYLLVDTKIQMFQTIGLYGWTMVVCRCCLLSSTYNLKRHTADGQGSGLLQPAHRRGEGNRALLARFEWGRKRRNIRKGDWLRSLRKRQLVACQREGFLTLVRDRKRDRQLARMVFTEENAPDEQRMVQHLGATRWR